MDKGKSFELGYNGAIDFTKFIAAIIIVIHHFQLGTGLKFSYVNFTTDDLFFCGANMVEVFFVISGFLSWRYIDKIKKDGRFADYFLDKIKRVFPWLVGTNFLSALTKAIFIHVSKSVPFGKVTLWSFILGSLPLNVGVVCDLKDVPNETMWYISVLMLCYILLYICVRISESKRIKESYFFLFILIIGLAIKGYSIQMPIFNNLTARGYVAFSIGLLLPWVINKIDTEIRLNYRKVIAVLLVLLSIIYVVAHHMFICGEIGTNTYVFFADQMSLIIACIFTPMLIIVFSTKSVTEHTNKRIFHMLGKVSFSLYIWHLPLIYIVKSIICVYPTLNQSNFLIISLWMIIVFSVVIDSIFRVLWMRIKSLAER